jgi:hypothetical protein
VDVEPFVIDFSRRLSAKELRAFQARRSRLNGVFGESAEKATHRFNTRLGAPGRFAQGLRIRTPFSCLRVPIAEDAVSDRAAPRRELRPPATQIVTSQGAALRLYLTAIAAAQINTKPGNRFINAHPLSGDSQTTGWDDLLATSAVPSGKGATVSMTRDKKARSIRSALDNLDRAGLVLLPGTPGKRGRHNGFTLLNDIGWQNEGEPLQYTVPTYKEDYFLLPAGFVTKGWLSVLEDSEVAVLLMIACGRYGLGQIHDDFDLLDGEVAIPGDERLRRYGIHRDPFSTARKTLDWFGLISVREIERHWEDGRGEDGTTHLHRLRLIPEAFEANAFDVVRHVLDAQLERRTGV